MADERLFGRLMPSEKILPHFWKIRGKYFSKTNRAKNFDAIASYFRELEEHTEVLESKYHPDNSAFASVECFDFCEHKTHDWKAAEENPQEDNDKETPSICTPWRGNFTIDVPLLVFDYF